MIPHPAETQICIFLLDQCLFLRQHNNFWTVWFQHMALPCLFRVLLVLPSALQPAEVILDEARKQQLQAEADAAAQAPLPEDDDDII